MDTLEGAMLERAHHAQDIREQRGRDGGRSVLSTARDALFDVLAPPRGPRTPVRLTPEQVGLVLGPFKSLSYERRFGTWYVLLTSDNGWKLACQIIQDGDTEMWQVPAEPERT